MDLAIDLIDGGDLSVEYPPTGGEIVKASRTARVKGLTLGGADDAKIAMDRAVNYLLSQYPRGSIYTPRFSQARLLSVRATGIDKDDDAVIIRMGYDTVPKKPPEGGIIPWTVEDSTTIVQNTTQVDPRTWEPLSVKFTDPNNANNNFTDIVSLSYPSTIRTLVLSGYKLEAELEKLRKAVNTVNEDSFLGKKPGWWRFSAFRDSFPILVDTERVINPIYFISVELQTQGERDWQVFGILRDPHTRKYVPIPKKTMEHLKETPYHRGIRRGNGVLLLAPYEMTNFGQLFGRVPVA